MATEVLEKIKDRLTPEELAEVNNIVSKSIVALGTDEAFALRDSEGERRDRRAAELGLAATLQVGPDPSGQQEVSVRLAGDSPPQLSLRFVHPTREELDWRVALDRSGDGYRGLSRQPDTRVYLLLMDAYESWRLTGELRPV